MKRIGGLLLLGGLFVVFQSGFWPHLVGWQVKPDLILVLVVYIGLTESLLGGGLLVLFLGSSLDAVAGSHPGLHGVVLLLIFYVIRFVAGRFNTESSMLLLFMVACGTLLQAALLILFGSFAEAGGLWWEILRVFFPQVLLNLIAAWLLLWLAPWLQRRLAPQTELPGLKRLDQRHGT